VVTPARDEEAHLPRLAASLAAQSITPDRWIIVENNSSDRTLEIAEELARRHDWIRVRTVAGSAVAERGAPIVRALHAGFAEVDSGTEILVNVDADVSMSPDYFERLLQAFSADPELGIASGSAYEPAENGGWQQRFVTGGTVWGAVRAYRRACLNHVLPLEERHGWDGLDQLKARALGWHTKTFLELPFEHHRREGERDGSTWAHWRACGASAHYMGYRPLYLLARAGYQARRDPAAVAMLWGFAEAVVARAPRWSDRGGRERLRRDQSLRNLLRRRREARGVEEPLGD
jgi:glycosyltransferase involved in cell wall biosynthesis